MVPGAACMFQATRQGDLGGNTQTSSVSPDWGTPREGLSPPLDWGSPVAGTFPPLLVSSCTRRDKTPLPDHLTILRGA